MSSDREWDSVATPGQAKISVHFKAATNLPADAAAVFSIEYVIDDSMHCAVDRDNLVDIMNTIYEYLKEEEDV